MNSPDKLTLQPKTFVLKHVRADLKTLFLSLGEAAAQAKIGEAGEALGAFFRAVESVRIERPPEELAWQLVCDGLARATTELLRLDDEEAPPAVVYDGDLDHLKNRTEMLVKEAELAITRDFFKSPSALPILGGVERTLASWLRFLQPNEPNASRFNESQACALAARLRGYFPIALHEEWRRHRDRYEPLFEYFDTPFAEAAQMAWDWERNRLELIRQMDLPVFEETFSLRQVYVPLRAYTLEDIEGDEPGRDRRKRRCRIFMLQDEIESWLEHGPKAGDDIRLVTGGPGSGKSTFAKWLAADVSEKRRMRVLFFPLQRFRVEKRLDDAIARYLTTTGRFRNSPIAQEGFASPGDPLLVVFDGLDELTKPGDLADEQTNQFIGELRYNLDLWNGHGVRVLALITGRTVYVQAKRPLLRIADRQEVAVLPYLVDEDRRKELCEHHKASGQDLLKDDQREQWWPNYAVAKGLENTSLPEIFKTNNDLRELTADPLLNYLVALSGFHEQVAADAEINRNLIYARLLKDVLDRRHAKKAQTESVALAPVEEAKDRGRFEQLLESIALAAWYGDGRTTTRGEIETLLPRGLQATWQELVAGGPGFTRLIAAFYFRQAGASAATDARQAEGSAATDAIEFTHKSFGEYLTARRLVREIDDLHQELRRGGRYKEDDALGDWAQLAGAQAMTMDLLRFLRDEVALRPMEDVTAWQATLTSLFNLELRTGFRLAALSATDFREAEVRARNSEETLLVLLNACAIYARTRSKIQWASELGGTGPSVHAAGNVIHRLRRQRFVIDACPAFRALSWSDLSHQNLMIQDMFGAELHNSALAAGDFRGADLRQADLRKVDLRQALLTEARAREANLDEADLSEANLNRADLSGANLSGANFSGADLSGADLRGVKNLTEEQIMSARNISGAKLPDHLKHLETEGPRASRKPTPSPRR